DGMATGAIAALKRAGYATLPALTGQDAELAAVQRIITGEQTMTIYLDTKGQAENAAEAAAALAKGEKPTTTTTVNNGTADIPTTLLDPIAVTKDNIKEPIVAADFSHGPEMCTAAH